jgi:hypothetical protein
MIRKELRLPILALFVLSLAGWLIHGRAHPVSFNPAHPSNPAFLVPWIAGLIGIFAVPLLLNYRSTFVVGYLLNGMSVVIGTITMADWSIDHLPAPLTFQSVLFGTMLSSILILVPKLFVGQIVLLHYHPKGMGRLFTPFWWTRHYVYLGAVYVLGQILWR